MSGVMANSLNFVSEAIAKILESGTDNFSDRNPVGKRATSTKKLVEDNSGNSWVSKDRPELQTIFKISRFVNKESE